MCERAHFKVRWHTLRKVTAVSDVVSGVGLACADGYNIMNALRTLRELSCSCKTECMIGDT